MNALDTSQANGFTLVELVMVMILIGVLSALGIGLFTRSSAFSPLLATQQLQSATLLAQQAALAGKSKSRVEIVGTKFKTAFDKENGSSATIQSFDLDGENFSTSPSNVTIYFNKLAVPTNASGTRLNATSIEISKDGIQFALCISSWGAVYQIDSSELCDD